jgi:hypothetical protein
MIFLGDRLMNIIRPATTAADNASAVMTGPISSQLAAFAEGLSLGDVPEAVIARAKLHILDHLRLRPTRRKQHPRPGR